MALSQRPASRFFAAFYRWSQHSQQPPQCPISSAYRRRITPLSTATRRYHATRLQRQHDRPQAQDEETAKKNEGTRDEELDPPNELNSGNPGPISAGAPAAASKSATRQDEAISHEGDSAKKEADTLRNDVRNLMRKVPSSVAVITVASVDAELNTNVPMGVAVSSLSTVSMDPPTISFNIKHPSKTLDAIRSAKGLFRVHFPAADRGGATMVELFCRGNHAEAYAARRRGLRLFVPGFNSFPDKLQASASNAPQIFGNSVRAALECTLTHEFQVGDHVILVASVDKIDSKTSDVRTILYVDGTYMRPEGHTFTAHGQSAISSDDNWSPWDFPLFPGDAERHDYVERIQSIVKKNPKLLQGGKETLGELERTLGLSPAALGINLELLIGALRADSGRPSDLSPQPTKLSPLTDFYGRITPSDRDKIYERAKNLVREDAHFLSMNYRLFLQHLGVSTSSIDLLPSDILTSLREAGLVRPFQPRTTGPSSHSRAYDLVYLEQVEYGIKEHLTALHYEEAIRTRLSDVVVALGEEQSVSTYFKKARACLLTNASPLLFKSPKIDISGQVSPEEACVVMSRVVRFLHLSTRWKNIRLDPIDVLRRVGVHPCITGFDVDFLFGKLRHLYQTTSKLQDLSSRVEEILEPWFANTVTWPDLEERVQSFVKKMPARAMSWNNRDKLSAMGLSWDVVLTVPIVKNCQPLNRGPVLDTLVARELKSLYGKLSDELNEAIARYLRRQYNFDIEAKSAEYSPIDAETRSSHDEMQEALLASRNVDVMVKKLGKPRDASRRHGDGPRVRFQRTEARGAAVYRPERKSPEDEKT